MSELAVKDASEIRDDILRVVSNGLRARGVTSPAVGFGTDYYVVAQALANELEAQYAQAVTAGDDVMPDTATGDRLDSWLSALGLARRAASSSTGFVTLVSTASTTILTGTELTDSLGQRFTIDTGGTYANGDLLAISSVASGVGTNIAGGTVLRWTSPPAYASGTAAVTSAGLTGGADDEGVESARARLLDALGSPANAGSWSHVARLAEQGHPSIEKAFVYPAANGPSTVHVACVGYASATTTRQRVVSATALAAATSKLTGELPEGIEITNTASVAVTTSVALELTLPEATTAIPAGNGGGWVDGTPWPTVYDASGTASTQRYCDVSAVTSTTVFRVQACTAPVVGQTICYVDNATFVLYTSTLSAVATISGPSLPGTLGVYEVTLAKPFPDVAVGDIIFPGMERAQAYVDAVLAGFGAMGPGEKTNVAGVLPRAYRRPRYFDAWPYSLDDRFLRRVIDTGDEVLSATWLYRQTTTPAVPGAITSGPNLLVPNRIGFYHGAP